MIPKIVFCPNCHKPIKVPKIAGQVNTINGINIECPCGGKVKIKSEKQ